MAVKQHAPAPTQAREPEERRIKLELRVYVYLRDGRWYADAPSIALLTEGASEEEATRCLLEQVVAYLRTAARHGWMEQLHRPASLRHRLWLRSQFLLARFQHRPSRVRIEPIHV